MLLPLALVAQLSVAAHAPDTGSVCAPVEVSIAARIDGTVVPHLTSADFGQLTVLRSSAVPRVSRERQGTSVMAEWRFIVVAPRAGVYPIPAFEVRAGSESARVPARRYVAVDQRMTPEPQVIADVRVDTGTGRQLRGLAAPETVYVGQQANYEVAVHLNRTVRDRLRRNPTFYPPDMPAMLAYDIAPGASDGGRKVTAGGCFESLLYRRALFPLLPGRLVIPPAQLSYALPLSASFFSREETRELTTDSAVVIAIAPPVAGRPADYRGAVGTFTVSSRLAAGNPRVGDPITLIVRVAGSGNIKLLPRPKLEVPWASLVAGDERVEADSSGLRIRGSKEFQWVLTPIRDGDQVVPPVHYPQFDPSRREYGESVAPALPVSVRAGTLASSDTASVVPPAPIRRTYRGDIAPPFTQHGAFWLLLALAPLPALAESWRTRRRRLVLQRDAGAVLRDVARRHGGEPRRVRRALVEALAARLSIPAEPFTRAGALARALRLGGVSGDIAADVEALLSQLDAAAYAHAAAPPDASARALALYRRVDDEALHRVELAGVSPLALLLLAVGLGASALHASAQDPAAAFSDGVQQYEQRDFAAAESTFRVVTIAAPRAADAWANLGTAAFAAGDTVTAVRGWRVALDFEPASGDARAHLDDIAPLGMRNPGWLPALPRSTVALCAAVLWLAACAAAFARARGRLLPRAWVLVAGGAAVLVGASGLLLDERTDVRKLAVVRGADRLRDDPTLGGDAGADVVRGEIVRRLGQQGVWVRVRVDGGAEGWVSSDMLQPIAPGSD
ncbi:MAG: Aerotolerance-related protein BatD [Gemmatimonadetes bacterium]|nr:Aerotolerance-related protein BatD [Gemmatimonadota bacterium]